MNERTEERFRGKFKNNCDGGCWEWQASLDACGYGKFRIGKKMVGAHRVSYEIHVGRIPDGLHVLHKCDNRKCVNPEHLFLGTHKDNMEDRKRKGRGNSPLGSRSGMSKLTEAAVRKIKSANPYYGITADLGREFNVSKVLISQIRRGLIWKHV